MESASGAPPHPGQASAARSGSDYDLDLFAGAVAEVRQLISTAAARPALADLVRQAALAAGRLSTAQRPVKPCMRSLRREVLRRPIWDDPAQYNRKPAGMACVDGILYLAMQDLKYGQNAFNESPTASISRSDDHARTWHATGTAMFPNSRFSAVFFLDFGKYYGQAGGGARVARRRTSTPTAWTGTGATPTATRCRTRPGCCHPVEVHQRRRPDDVGAVELFRGQHCRAQRLPVQPPAAPRHTRTRQQAPAPGPLREPGARADGVTPGPEERAHGHWQYDNDGDRSTSEDSFDQSNRDLDWWGYVWPVPTFSAVPFTRPARCFPTAAGSPRSTAGCGYRFVATCAGSTSVPYASRPTALRQHRGPHHHVHAEVHPDDRRRHPHHRTARRHLVLHIHRGARGLLRLTLVDLQQRQTVHDRRGCRCRPARSAEVRQGRRGFPSRVEVHGECLLECVECRSPGWVALAYASPLPCRPRPADRHGAGGQQAGVAPTAAVISFIARRASPASSV